MAGLGADAAPTRAIIPVVSASAPNFSFVNTVTDPIPAHYRALHLQYLDRNTVARAVVIISGSYNPLNGRLRGKIPDALSSSSRPSLALDSRIESVDTLTPFNEGMAALATLNQTVYELGEEALPPPFAVEPQLVLRPTQAGEGFLRERERARTRANTTPEIVPANTAADQDSAFTRGRRGRAHALRGNISHVIEVSALLGPLVQVRLTNQGDMEVALRRDGFSWDWDR